MQTEYIMLKHFEGFERIQMLEFQSALAAISLEYQKVQTQMRRELVQLL